MEKRPNDTIEMLRAEFANVRKTAIVGHLHPDGDCISSCLALYHYLKDNYGYEADVYLEPYPSVFDMLPDTAVIRHTVKPEVYDVVYSLDCADLDRIGAGKELFDSAKKRVMIDHHISNPVFGDVKPHSFLMAFSYGLIWKLRRWRDFILHQQNLTAL